MQHSKKSPRAAERYHGYLAIQSRGVVTIPRDLRARMHTDVPGAQLEVTERDDGVFEVRPTLPIAADQSWFWTERWQAMEREADADVAEGRVARFDDVESFLDELDR